MASSIGRQRAALARALAAGPAVLVCDEITSALDRAVGQSVLGLLAALRGQFGLTAIVITHDTAVAAVADRVLVLEAGRVSEARAHDAVPADGQRIFRLSPSNAVDAR